MGIQTEEEPQDILPPINDNDAPINDNDVLERSTEYPDRPLINRMFGKMQEGSLRGSIFAVSSLALGTGCLSLPIRFTQVSLAGGLVSLTLGAVITYWTLTLMIKSSKNSKTRDYSRLVSESIGKCPAIFLDATIMLYIFGVLISFQVIIYNTAGRVFFELTGQNNSYADFDDFNKLKWDTTLYKFPIMFSICAVLIPLCMLKDISRMRFTSMFSVCSLLYVITVVVVEAPSYYKHYLRNIRIEDDVNTHENWYDISKAFGKDLLIFQSFATMFFSFSCHIGAFPVYKTLANPSVRRIQKVFKRSILIDIVLYYLVSVAGFFTAPINTPALIIYREPKDKGIDIAMTIAKCALCINLMLSLPANYNGFRISFCELVMGIDTEKLSNVKNCLLTLIVLSVSCAIGAFYNNIISYITVLGGTGSVIMCFLMPGLLYVKNNGKGVTHWQNVLVMLVILVLCVIGFTGAVQMLLGVK